jgi:2-isopropylmalate synthase
VQWRVDIASGEPADAEVVLMHNDQRIVGMAQGNGPVDAIFKAIDAAAGAETRLEYYHVEAVTPGYDAQGNVHVRIRVGEQLYTGHGLATDIVEASARAYLAALSRVEQRQPSAVLAGTGVSRFG